MTLSTLSHTMDLQTKSMGNGLTLGLLEGVRLFPIGFLGLLFDGAEGARSLGASQVVFLPLVAETITHIYIKIIIKLTEYSRI